MDNSVIVLDSSDDEIAGSPVKKSRKMMKKSRSHHQTLADQKFISSNKSATVTKFHGKSNSHSAVKPLNSIPNNISCTVISSSITKNGNINNNNNNNKRRKENNETNNVDETYFNNKIQTGELTLVPINNNLPITPTPTPSPLSSPNSAISSTIRIEEHCEKITCVSSSVIAQSKPIKRITPIKISEVVSLNENSASAKSTNNKKLDPNSVNKMSYYTNDISLLSPNDNEDSNSGSGPPEAKKSKAIEKTPINETFAALIDACRAADSSSDMDKLIDKKLVRYYQSVHPDFVNSKSFCKNIRSVMDEIKAQPHLVYLKLKGVLEELNTRRKSGETVVVNDKIVSTGDVNKDFQIRKLNRALYELKKKIKKLDEKEVDWDDEDNSIFMICERYKKRACEIYEKICDITGESKNAERLVKNPLKFNGTSYREFNRTLQTFVNETKSFPDMFDVLRCLEHCNLQYNYRLSKEDCKRIAQDAFIKIGKLLQKRRKTDLYEMVSYFTAEGKDPALEDTTLQSKLSENQKYHKQINDLIDKYAQQQDKSSFAMDTIGSGSAEKFDSSDNELIGDDFKITTIKINSKETIELDDDETNMKVTIERTRELSSSSSRSHTNNIDNTLPKNGDILSNVNNLDLGGPSIVSVTSLNDIHLDMDLDTILNEDKIIISDDEDL